VKLAAPNVLLLQQRDLELIVLVYRYGGVTVGLLRRRFWPSVRSKSTYYNRLQSLISHNYLRAIKSANPLTGYHGVGWLTIGPRAKQVLADALGIPIEQVKEGSKTISPIRVAHTTLLHELRLSLELAELRYSSLTILDWLSEDYFKVSPLTFQFGPTQAERVLHPDGAFTVQIPTARLSAFVEGDRGTITSLPDLRTRFRDYLLFTRTLRTPRPVLWVVPTTQRLKQLERIASQEAQALKDDPTIFFLTTREQVSEHTLLFSPIWTVAGGPPRKALFDQPTVAVWQASNPVNT
jgi:hypothetical protein